MAQWLDGTIKKRIDWNDHLFSLVIDCPEFGPFHAGQFTKVGVEQADGKVLSRPYSLVNPPSQSEPEILAVPVEEGKLSPLLHTLNTGDPVKVMMPATGFLTMKEVPESQTLWMVATGTGVGPFLSILATDEPWQQYERIVLVYAARFGADLAYLEKVEQWQRLYPERFHFVPIVSREKQENCLRGRIPELLLNGKIETQTGITLGPENNQVMLCGNPQMIKDVMEVLMDRGLKKHLRRAPGHISMEQYW